jgi:glyoxylase-like metal-dependent hydrolase (beta-lactamase superfamily II)
VPRPAPYEVHAIRYARHAERNARDNFIGGDPHDGPAPLDYFVWLVRGEAGTFVVDTGFDAAAAKARGRTLTRPVEAGLLALGVEASSVPQVIVTHMHYDHAGNRRLFPAAQYHLQDAEMAYCTGRFMTRPALAHAYAADDVAAMVARTFERRVVFHAGDDEIAPGLSVHLIGGHTGGLQAVRVWTRRGWLVLASDAAHLFANLEQGRPFPIVHDVGAMLEGHRTVRRLASSDDLVIPGHDPLVLGRWPAPRAELAGWVARLDADPI